ncbi:hypothetical protein CSC67_01430 [Pusillimonas caeni]|uniref:hypothetical protein n=1 Tax=Pusillimonas caeni TaxID=1348472 RepID=UPI001074AB64|nr:hypothetical protein [Pusillimonas caeni]TFL15422.1 hypothetical protein CSC67_01430 [Pusillimonas caeni]
MPSSTNPTHTEKHGKKKPRRVTPGRAAGLMLLALVLAVAFMGHLTPAMRVQWANFVSLCGF